MTIQFPKKSKLTYEPTYLNLCINEIIKKNKWSLAYHPFMPLSSK